MVIVNRLRIIITLNLDHDMAEDAGLENDMNVMVD